MQIVLESVSKRFTSKRALDDVSLTIEAGQIVDANMRRPLPTPLAFKTTARAVGKIIGATMLLRHRPSRISHPPSAI